MEEEFIKNQERLKPQEENKEKERLKQEQEKKKEEAKKAEAKKKEQVCEMMQSVTQSGHVSCTLLDQSRKYDGTCRVSFHIKAMSMT